MSRLHKAAAAGDLITVQECLASGENVNDMTETVTLKGEVYSMPSIVTGVFIRKMTPLHLAAYNDHTAVARILAQAPGIDLNLRLKNAWNTTTGDTALEIAVERKNFGLAKMLSELGATDEHWALEKAMASINIDELFQAALHKKPEVILSLHAEGLLNKKNGEKTLFYAAKYDSVDVAKALIQCGISPSCHIESNSAMNEYSTPLGIAAASGSEKVVELLLKSYNVNVDDYTSVTHLQADCTPLREAILHSADHKPNPRIVAMLLSHGADVEKINPRGISCLAITGDADEVELLLQAGLSPNIEAEGKPLLSRCISEGKFQIAIKLIKYGAKVDFVENGETYLHRSRDAQLTQALIDKGLDVNAADHQGRKPVECNRDRISVEIMVRAGASISGLSMHHHVVLSSVTLTEILIERGQADFLQLNANGKTPLQILAINAALDGYLETLEYILRNVPGININQASATGGWTPLHEAFALVNFHDTRAEYENTAKNNYAKAIDLLIAHGAQPLKDAVGRTPLMCLTFSGFSSSFNRTVIEKYYRYEAEHYGFCPEFYKQELIELRARRYQQLRAPRGVFSSITTPVPVVLGQFWDIQKRSEVVKNARLLSQAKRSNRSSLFSLPYELMRHVAGYTGTGLTEGNSDQLAFDGLYYCKKRRVR